MVEDTVAWEDKLSRYLKLGLRHIAPWVDEITSRYGHVMRMRKRFVGESD